jgi:hypothetical protein
LGIKDLKIFDPRDEGVDFEDGAVTVGGTAGRKRPLP